MDPASLVLAAVSAATAPFHAEAPPGFQPAWGISAPVIAYYSKRLYDGEAALIVERYWTAEGAEIGAFARNLGLGENPKPKRRRIDGKAFDVYEGITTESYTRVVPPADPYSDSLGSKPPPPRLSFLESHRFQIGGEAYRLYRCRKQGAWRLLSRYRRLRSKGEDLYPFQAKELDTAARKLVSACFGQGVLLAMSRGDEAPDIPKPSGYRLRLMARQEWDTGASSRVELECVHVRPAAGGFFVVRFRAPKAEFSSERAAFNRFLSSFQPENKP
ncbi:MAG: hypothetical protein HY922_07445 [Elusimicrobia bacterium]|nr:hypothetical protein [Elusimicrobiota bacterium]